MPNYHSIEDFQDYERQYGHPAHGLAPETVADLLQNGFPLPRKNLGIIGASPLGQCGHCGVPVPEGQHRAVHALAGFEDAVHPTTREPLRMLIDHCREHWRGDHCSRDAVTPGSGWAQDPRPHSAELGILSGAAGWCEPLEVADTLHGGLIPGAPYLARYLRWLAKGGLWSVSAAGLWAMSHLILTSQGQMVADLSGPVTALLAPSADTVAGDGYNAGHIGVWDATGGVPATANATAAGAVQLIYWLLTSSPQAFGAGTAALPSVSTAAAIANVNALATATAAFARLVQSTDTAWTLSTTLRRYQLTVGAGSGELSFNTLSISSGGACSITSFTMTHGS